MPTMTVKPQPFDPYKNFRFRLRFTTSATYVAGANDVSGLKHAAQPAAHHGDPAGQPGRTKFDAITIERGVTHDSAFEGWIGEAWTPGNAQVPADFRRDIVIDVFDEAGRRQLSYAVHHAWVSEFAAQADLDANADALLIERMKIENEGWERHSDDGSKKKKAGRGKRRRKPARKKSARKKSARKKAARKKATRRKPARKK